MLAFGQQTTILQFENGTTANLTQWLKRAILGQVFFNTETKVLHICYQSAGVKSGKTQTIEPTATGQ